MTSDTETPIGLDASKVAYIRAIEVNELESLPREALDMIDDTAALFVLTNGKGEKLAIVEGREAAFKAAEMNSLTPMSVH